MAFFYLSEFASLGMVGNQVGQVPPVPEITTQKIAITAGSTLGAPFNASTVLIQVHADAICSVEFNGAAATTASMRMAANETRFYAVPRGASASVAVIANT